jgi:segregation and condensation protein B
MQLDQAIEAILFFRNEATSIKKLSEILKVSTEEIGEGLILLKQKYENRGIVLVQKEDEVMLATAPQFSDMIETLQKEELSKDLSKASLETLSIILYKNGASRADIDYIRGVNSSFTLRALSVRGLIEKIPDPKDSRKYLYKATFDLLTYLGLSTIAELPMYLETQRDLNSLKEDVYTTQENQEKENITNK